MDLIEALQWLIILITCYSFWRFMRAPGNPLQWWHFIATKAKDGSYYADLDKLGKATGVIVGSWALLKISGSATTDFVGFAVVLGSYFAFVGSIAGYSAYLRYKNDALQKGKENGNPQT